MFLTFLVSVSDAIPIKLKKAAKITINSEIPSTPTI